MQEVLANFICENRIKSQVGFNKKRTVSLRANILIRLVVLGKWMRDFVRKKKKGGWRHGKGFFAKLEKYLLAFKTLK